MQRKQRKCKALFAVLTLTLLLSFAPVCHAADNLTNFNTICDWAETTLPDYFSPMGEQTFEASGYFIRYYQNTNTYVGTINGNFYVLGGAFGNEVVYVGTNEYLLSLISPPDAITFAKTFGGTDFDNGNFMQQTADGGYIITGETNSSGAGEGDVYLLKTDSSGNESWSKTFGGAGWDYGNSVQQTADGGYIIVGTTWSSSAGQGDVYLLKTDSSGNETWSKTFGGTNHDSGSSVRQTTDGGFIIVGSTGSFGAGGGDIYLIKTDSGGNKTWAKTFGNTYYDSGYSVQQTADGGFIIAGDTDSSGTGKGDIYLLKTDSNGNETWAKTFGGTDYDHGKSAQQTADGGYIIIGYGESSGVGGDDVYLIKTDSGGDEIWSKTFGGTDDDKGYSVQQTADGGFIIAGDTYSYGAGMADVYLIKTDSNGNETWAKTFGGTDHDSGESVQLTADGGFTIVGSTMSCGAGESDVYLLKTDSNGNVNDEQAVCTNTDQTTQDHCVDLTGQWSVLMHLKCGDNPEYTQLTVADSGPITQDGCQITFTGAEGDTFHGIVTGNDVEFTANYSVSGITVEAEGYVTLQDNGELRGEASVNYQIPGCTSSSYAIVQGFPE